MGRGILRVAGTRLLLVLGSGLVDVMGNPELHSISYIKYAILDIKHLREMSTAQTYKLEHESALDYFVVPTVTTSRVL